MNLAHVWLDWIIQDIYRFDLNIEILKPTPQQLRKSLIFWQWHFNFQQQGGYIGLQLAKTKKKAIFSIWDAIKGKHPCCHFSHEGKGIQCLDDYDWKLGNKYRLSVRQVMKSIDENWYIGEIYDYSTHQLITIGEILVPYSFGRLSAHNYYTCVEYGYFDNKNLPHSKVRFSGHYAYNGKEDGPSHLRARTPKIDYPDCRGFSEVTLCKDGSYIIEVRKGKQVLNH